MTKRKIDLRIPLLFIWPFGAFLLSLKSLSARSTKYIYILFTTLLGYSFSFALKSADSFRVAWVFKNVDYSSISTTIDKYLQGYTPDLYKYLSYGIVDKFTGNPKVLFALFGFIFGIFSYKSLKLFFDVKGLQKGLHISIIAFLFFALNSFININGARFYTGAIICICAVINLFAYNRKIWILPLICTVLCHFSFLFIVPLLLIMFLLKGKLFEGESIPKWILLLYFFAFFVSFLHSSNILNLEVLGQFLPRSVARKVEIYNSDELTAVIEQRNNSFFHTVKNIFSSITRFYLFLIILFIHKTLRLQKVKNEELQRLFSFCLLFLSLTYLLFIFPSGGRFATIATQFFFFFLLRFYILNKSQTINRFILGLIPVYTFFVLFNIGFLAYNLLSPTLFYGNLFWIIYEGWGFEFNFSLY